MNNKFTPTPAHLLEYTKHFPDGFTSWVDFYASTKIDYPADADDFVYREAFFRGPLNARESGDLQLKYSVRYIEQQTLAELFDLRSLKTFDQGELRYLHFALELTGGYESGTGDPKLVARRKKVMSCFCTSGKKGEKANEH